MRERIHKFISDLSIRLKFFISFIIILLLAYMVLIVVNSIFLTKDIKEQTLFSAEKALYQTKDYIEYKVNFTANLLNVVAINDTLQQLLQRDNSVYENDIGRWSIDDDIIQKILFYGKDVPGAKAMKIYFTGGLGTIYENSRYLNLNKYMDQDWFITLSEGTNMVQWFTGQDFTDETDPFSIIALKKIASSTNLNKAIGVLRLDYEQNEFTSLLSQANVTENTSAILFSKNKIIGISEDLDEASDGELIKHIVMTVNKTTDEAWTELSYASETYQLGVTDIDRTDWKLLLIIPNSDITKSIYRSQFNLFYILLGIIPLTVPLAYFFSRTITKRISELIMRIQEVGKINLDQEVGATGMDEIGILTRNFNYMLVRISMLLDEKFELGQELNRTELKALQAQINPHFLYNTLDQIYWMGVASNNDEISDLVLELSKFYKLSLGKGQELVTLEDELNHIEAYVKIQNYRFNNAIELIIDVSERSKLTRIPKITLQPIIENAILHGIMESEVESGMILVTTEEQDECLHIIVQDTGKGMTETMLKALKSMDGKPDDSSEPKQGYGLHNIDRRLKLVFGSLYGLDFDSIEGSGTTVSISIPFST